MSDCVCQPKDKSPFFQLTLNGSISDGLKKRSTLLSSNVGSFLVYLNSDGELSNKRHLPGGIRILVPIDILLDSKYLGPTIKSEYLHVKLIFK